MKITFEVDDVAAAALAYVIRRLDPRTLSWVPDDFVVDGAWERAVDALSPELPPSTPEQRAAENRRAAELEG